MIPDIISLSLLDDTFGKDDIKKYSVLNLIPLEDIDFDNYSDTRIREEFMSNFEIYELSLVDEIDQYFNIVF